jgi:Bacterial Ig domain
MKKIMAIAIAVACLFLACKKQPAAVPEPLITFTSPAANQHFVKGDTIHITGTVTHDIEILEVAVHMTDNSTSSEFFHNHFSAGNKTYFEFNSVYGITENTKTTFKVEVEVTDKNSHTGQKELAISIN